MYVCMYVCVCFCKEWAMKGFHMVTADEEDMEVCVRTCVYVCMCKRWDVKGSSLWW